MLFLEFQRQSSSYIQKIKEFKNKKDRKIKKASFSFCFFSLFFVGGV